MNTLNVGDPVEYVDEFSQPHAALITANHGATEFEDDAWFPSVNLVYVSSDDSQRDSYGRQIARNTSVVHENNQQAAGRYWRFLK